MFFEDKKNNVLIDYKYDAFCIHYSIQNCYKGMN